MRPPDRYRKGQRVEHYDAGHKRFGNPWRPAVVTRGLYSIPRKDGGEIWAVCVSHVIDGKPSATQFMCDVDEDGESEHLRSEQ